MFAELALTALVIEAAFGFPDVLYRRIGHPVGWIGALIARCDRAWNRLEFSFECRRIAGVGTLLLLLAVSGISATVIFQLAQHFLAGFAATLVCGAVASTLLAQRSLDVHVRAVADALEQEGIEAAVVPCRCLSGADTAGSMVGISRAAIESLHGEFFRRRRGAAVLLLAAGCSGIFGYKAINTADSMIGHKSERYLAFGWASARVDDLVNLPASRLSALWLVLAAAALSGLSPRGAISAVWRDANGHRSPNAGWPEAAMAGALGLRLAGPRAYDGAVVDDRWIGDGRETAGAGDIRLALRQYRVACAIQFVSVAALAAMALL